ncbi:unnamed protein product [[Candida] boidinii]|nr:unnamed protein product [[Candida] boidinii]
MSKRSAEEVTPTKALKKDSNDLPSHVENEVEMSIEEQEMGELEDLSGDDYESEGEIIEIDKSDDEDEEVEDK